MLLCVNVVVCVRECVRPSLSSGALSQRDLNANLFSISIGTLGSSVLTLIMHQYNLEILLNSNCF